jgi:CheY-like chemotaxis protein
MARVLLVDDDAGGLEIRKMLLEREGHQVWTATDAAVARNRFSSFAPDCVILDLRLPSPEDGLALVREFREAAPNVRIVVLAGWGADLEGRPERKMVNEVLAKPVRSERLMSAVRKKA